MKDFEWKTALAKYPSATQEMFIEGYVIMVVNEKANAPLPPAFLKDLDERITDDQEAMKQSSALKRQVTNSVHKMIVHF